MPEAAGRVELAALEILGEGVTEDAVPAIEVSQLPRSFAQRGEEGGDAHGSATGAMMLTIGAGDVDGGLSGMLGLPADRVEQQRPAGDRFAMLVRVGEADEQYSLPRVSSTMRSVLRLGTCRAIGTRPIPATVTRFQCRSWRAT